MKRKVVRAFPITFDISKRNSREQEIFALIKSGKYTQEEVSTFAKMMFLKHFKDFLQNNDLIYGTGFDRIDPKNSVSDYNDDDDDDEDYDIPLGDE